MMKKRVLVVEDDPVLARVLSDNLAYEGFEVRCVADGLLATGAAKEFAPDLVLLDVNLPGMSGFELTKAWRQAGRTALVLRAGRGGELELAAAHSLASAIVRLMGGMGMIATAETPPPSMMTTEVREYRGASGGFFVPEVRCGATVATGDLLGWVRAPLGGNPIEAIHAEKGGIVLSVRRYPLAHARELLLRVAEGG